MPIIDFRDYCRVEGYDWDGTDTDDMTDAINSAIRKLITAKCGGTIIIDGRMKTGTLKFETIDPETEELRKLNHNLVIEIHGSWTLTNTLVIPSYVAIVGNTGDTTSQFQTCSRAEIKAPTQSDIPAIKIIGSGECHVLKNLHIKEVKNIGILLDANNHPELGGNVWIENVSVDLDPNCSISAMPLKIDSCFWVFIKNCVFRSHENSADSSILLTMCNKSYNGHHVYVGLIYIDDTTIDWRGIKIEASELIEGPTANSFFLRNIIYENACNNFITLDSTNVPISIVELNNISVCIEDTTKKVYLIETIGHSVRNVSVVNTPISRNFVAGPNIQGLNISNCGQVIDYTTGFDTGKHQRDFTLNMFGWLEGIWSGQGSDFSPSIVPYESLTVQQDPNLWKNDIEIVRGPDGSLSAGRLEGDKEIRVYTEEFNNNAEGRKLNVGDWLIAGLWLKPVTRDAELSNDMPPYRESGVVLKYGGSDRKGYKFELLNGEPNPILSVTDPYHFRVNSPWMPAVKAGKIISVDYNEPVTLEFSIRSSASNPTDYFMPWLIYIPAGTFTDAEVHRLERYLTNVPSSVKAGYVSLYQHLGLYFGGKHISYGDAPPTEGSWNIGDIVYNNNPTEGGFIGWVCVTAGEPGEWRTFGIISTGGIAMPGIFGYASIDPMALILSDEEYIKWVELHNPHEPMLSKVREVVTLLNDRDKKFALAKAKVMIAYGNAVIEALS